MAETIARDCEKMMDTYSLSYVKRFGHNLLHPDGVAELVLVILMGKITTSALENTNAAIKHLLDVLSTHVKTPLMATLAEVVFLRKAKARNVHRECPLGLKRPRRKTEARSKKGLLGGSGDEG